MLLESLLFIHETRALYTIRFTQQCICCDIQDLAECIQLLQNSVKQLNFYCSYSFQCCFFSVNLSITTFRTFSLLFFHIAKYFSIQIHVKKLPLFSLIRKSDHLCPDAFPTQIALIFYLIYIPINKKGL